MAAYTGMGDGATEISHGDLKHFFRIKHRLTVATEMAAQTTPAANGYFTANDTIELFRWPANCLPLGLASKIITTCSVAATLDVGVTAGATELEDAIPLSAAAGVGLWKQYADATWHANFIAGTTIYGQFLTANPADGDVWLITLGVDMNL